MKDITKILPKLNLDIRNANFGLEQFYTIEDAVESLAKIIAINNSEVARALFKKYAIYVPKYVKENLSIFYPLISEQVEEMEVKALAKKSNRDISEIQEEING